jgi:hypothetical protein
MPDTVTVESTTDEQYIKSVFLNPAIYQSMRDDSCPQEPSMLADKDIKSIPGFFLRALMGDNAMGAFWFIWKGDSVEAHTALLPACRGRNAILAGKAAARWVFSNTSAKTITSYAWSDSPAVAWFCRMIGMNVTSVEPWPHTRSGKSVLIAHYELTPEGIK